MFDVILVHSFSRFFRDQFQLEFYVRRLAKKGVRLISITQELGDDPMSNMIRNLGADIVIDYKKDEFEKILSGFDVVLDSQDSDTLEKSLRVVKRGSAAVSISGPPDPAFARVRGLNSVSWSCAWLVPKSGSRPSAAASDIRSSSWSAAARS
jgi:NADPH:quinone reductase-like Zn-dependent oxidoreductase